MRIVSQDWHNRIVTELLHSSRGDLILSSSGDLCARNIWSDSVIELPWSQHTVGNVLATISGAGWKLTPNGADYILENCFSGSAQDRNKLDSIGYPQR